MYTSAQQDRDFDRWVQTVQLGNPLVHGPDPDPICPKCGSDDVTRRHHHGNALAPECHWYECNECGHKSDPS